jgi:hypothetical protein
MGGFKSPSQKADALRAVARRKEAHQKPTSRLLTSLISLQLSY